jgi:ketosteroid isomerase-like protein
MILTNKNTARTGGAFVNKLILGVLATLLTAVSLADHHRSAEAEVFLAVKAFNDAYAVNDVEDYFDFYTDDATLYFYGARQKVADYQDEWTAMLDAGGGVVKNELSDVHVQLLPGEDAAVATYFVHNAVRSPEGQTVAARAFETDVWQKIDGEWKIVSLHYTELVPED